MTAWAKRIATSLRSSQRQLELKETAASALMRLLAMTGGAKGICNADVHMFPHHDNQRMTDNAVNGTPDVLPDADNAVKIDDNRVTIGDNDVKMNDNGLKVVDNDVFCD
jgi:hypothetical protein